MPQYLSDKEHRRDDHDMKLTKALYLSVFGLAASGYAAALVINTAIEPAKRDADALPKPYPEAIPEPQRPAKRDADALPEPYPEAIPEPQRPAKRDADAFPEPYPEAIPEPQKPARK